MAPPPHDGPKVSTEQLFLDNSSTPTVQVLLLLINRIWKLIKLCHERKDVKRMLICYVVFHPQFDDMFIWFEVTDA
jgi:hypothetical protein